MDTTNTNSIINEDNFHRKKIYRYNFSKEVMDLLYNFSKIHQYDDNNTFKEAWNIWVVDNSDIMDIETEKMKNDGYTCNNINKKMYTSARYYFRKKTISGNGTEKIQRKKYTTTRRELINCMDIQILDTINKTPEFKPSEGFVDFCNNNKNVLKNELAFLLTQDIHDLKIIQDKIKKTYKNRCFSIISSFNRET